MPAATRIATYRPGYKATPLRPTPTPTTVPPPSFIPSVSTPSSTGSLILISLAILLSSGILVRTLHPKYRYRHVAPSSQKNTTSGKNSKKRRDTVVKSIILAQEAHGAGQESDKNEARGRSASEDVGRSRSSSSVASTSSAIFQGLSSFSIAALGASVSSSSSFPSRHEPTASGSRSPALSSNSPVQPTLGSEGPFGTGGVDYQAGKKSKGKKGKAVATISTAGTLKPPPLSPSSTLPSPTGSATSSLSRRIPSMNDAASGSDPPVQIEAGVQTAYPFLTFLAPDAASIYGFSVNEPVYAYPPLPDSPTLGLPPPILEPPRFPELQDACTQTSPVSVVRSTTFNLHASFQATPPSVSSRVSSSSLHQISGFSPPPSPSLSPSPSKIRLSMSNGTSPTLDPSLETPSAANSAASRSRKQRGKAAAQLSTNVVPGMPRPTRSRQTTDESESLLTSPSVRRTSCTQQPQQSLPRLVSSGPTFNSPETVALSLPKLSSSLGAGLPSNRPGKTRDFSSGTESASSSSKSAASGIAALLQSSTDPLAHDSSRRRPSTHSTPGTTPSHSNPSTSASTSPYLNHLVLMTMTPPDSTKGDLTALGASVNRRAKFSTEGGRDGEDDESSFRQHRASDAAGWDPVMGLGVEIERPKGNGKSDEPTAEGAPRRAKLGRTWSQVAVGVVPDPEGSLGDSSDSEPPNGGADPGYFPVQPALPFLSPPVSPRPAHAAALPSSNGMPVSVVPQRPWSPEVLASHYSMVPFGAPISPHSPHQKQYPTMSTSNSVSNLHSMMSHPQPMTPLNHTNGTGNGPSRPSSRQSSLSVPTSSQQQQHHHQQQQQQQQQQQLHAIQQQQQQQAYAYAHAQAQYQHAVALQMQAQQTLQQHPRGQHELSQSSGRPSIVTSPLYPPPYTQAQGWNSVPPSPSAPGSYTNLPSLVSPTSSSFPSSSYPYYQPAPATPFAPNTYHIPATPSHTSGHRGSDKRREPRKTSPRLGHDKASSSPGNAQDNLKAKLRMAEMEADRNGKELEIARWRLAVLEEDRNASEAETQEALAALAHRARRAEARLKYLEDVRQQDSSSTSASGSGSPVTRPSSIVDPGESHPDLLLPSVVGTDEIDVLRQPSPVGIKLHPLSWLDLDSVTFNTQPPRSRNLLSSPSGSKRGRGNRMSMANDFSRKRGSQTTQARRRSTNSHVHDARPLGDEESDEDVQIVLDSPIRRPPRPLSRHSSIADDDGVEPEPFGRLEDDEVSNIDLDESYVPLPEHSDYIGFLPPFLNMSQPSTPGQSTSTAIASESHSLSGDAILSIPSFVLDCATPSPGTPGLSESESTPALPTSPVMVADYTGRRRST